MYSGVSSNVDVSFASDVEITLKREVSLIVEEKYVIPLILYIVSSGSLQCLVVVVVVSVIVKLLLCLSWVFIGSKEGCKGGLCIRSLKLFKFNGKSIFFHEMIQSI